MYDKTSFGNMAKKNFWEKSTVEGNVLLRNKPDHGGAIGYVVALFPVLFLLLLFYAFIQEEWTWEGGIDALLDLLTIVAVAALPLLLYILILSKIYWELLGGETVYYSDSSIYIQQKKIVRKEVVIPWDCVLKVEAYDEPLLLLLVPTEDPTVCLTYKTPAGKTKKIRFGCHLNPKQQQFVVERINELLAEKFGK